jgi:D-alanyl-D-alanine-carboxypeptidase/D-alanyl-D-alanine-endopeptidase
MAPRVFIITLLLALTQTLSAQDIHRIDGTQISGDSLGRNIQKLMVRANVTGLCISVFNKNVPVYEKAFGYANAQEKKPMEISHVMYSASFSKAVFTYIAMKVVESGDIELDSPLVSYLDKPLMDYKFDKPGKGYQDLKNDPRYKKITARMCLDHTSGLPNYRSDESDGKLKILFEPGARYSYSGEGMCFLQFVIEQITGKDFEALAAQKVFRPMHMPHTSFISQDAVADRLCTGHDNAGRCYPILRNTEVDCSASMRTSLEDFSKFFTVIMEQKGLKKSSYKEIFKPQFRLRSKQQFGANSNIETADNDKIELSYGLGFVLMKTPFGPAFFKEGRVNGWQHYCIGYPDKDIAVIIMTNSDNGESIFRELLSASIADTFTPFYWENYP